MGHLSHVLSSVIPPAGALGTGPSRSASKSDEGFSAQVLLEHPGYLREGLGAYRPCFSTSVLPLFIKFGS